MNSRQIGFDRKVRLEWLEATARLVAQGLEPDGVQDKLQRLLDGQLSGKGERSARSKTITVLRRIWAHVPDQFNGFRRKALQLLEDTPQRLHVAVHWGMCIVAYGFFTELAANTGRLLRIQQRVAQQQVRRRLIEKYGERETLHYAAQRLLRSFVEWGVLQDAGDRGVYTASEALDLTEHAGLKVWLLEAMFLNSGRKTQSLSALQHNPALFPFSLHCSEAEVRSYDRLDVVRQASNQSYVVRKGSP